MIKSARIKGMTLVELMISMAIGLGISLAIVQVMVSNRVTNEFNQTVSEVQESGRFVMTRMRNELLEAGLYDSLGLPIAQGADVVSEAAFVNNHPIALANDFAISPALGSSNGAGSANDEIVVNLQSTQDCNGSSYGNPVGENFHVVNRYFVQGEQLRCQGYNGRVLRGIQNGTASSGTIVLMDGVKSFQLQYGISAAAGLSNGGAIQYVTADQLAGAAQNNQMVVAVRVAALVQSNGALSSLDSQKYTALDVTNLSVDNLHYAQVFSNTIALRNIKNFVRSM